MLSLSNKFVATFYISNCGNPETIKGESASVNNTVVSQIEIPSFSKLTHRLSAGAHLAFFRSCNTVAFLQEDKCIFVG